MSLGQINAHKVTLGTGKVVLLRDPTINDQEMAMQIAAPRAKDNPMLLVSFAQKEMIKLLILEIDGVKPSKSDLEQLSRFFSLFEFNQLQAYLGKMAAGDMGMGECQSELVAFGNK
jgi:hypothetical protein